MPPSASQEQNPYAILPTLSVGNEEDLPFGSYPKIEMVIRIAVSLVMTAAMLILGASLLQRFTYSVALGLVCALVIAICMRVLYAKRVTIARWMAQASRSSDALHYLAMCQCEQGNVQGAIENLTEVLEQTPDHARARSNRGVLHYHLDNFQACVDDCAATEESNPSWIPNRVTLGMSYEKLGQWELAEATFDRVLFDEHQSVYALAGRAAIRLATNRPELAMEDISQAERIQPDDPYVLSVHVDVLNRLERFKDSMPAAERLVKNDPNNVYSWLRLGETAIGLGDFPNANRAIERAESLAPNLPLTWTYKGVLQLESEKYEEAINAFEHAIELGPIEPSFLGQLGFARHLAGDSEAALRDLDDAIKLAAEDSRKAVLLNNRGFVRQSQRQFADAADDFQSAIDCDPQHPNAYKNWAWQMATCPDPAFRDGAKAVELASHAMELSQGRHQEWFKVLAAAHARAGNLKQAIECERQCHDEEMLERLASYERGQPWVDG